LSFPPLRMVPCDIPLIRPSGTFSLKGRRDNPRHLSRESLLPLREKVDRPSGRDG